MKKWIIIILTICLIITIFYSWDKTRKYNSIGNILSNIDFVDSISISDGKSPEPLLTLKEDDSIFKDLKDVYRSYHDLNWKSRKILENEKVYELDYLINNQHLFTINILSVVDDQIPLIPDDYITEINNTISYKLSPENDNKVYIIAISELNQIISLTEGVKELTNILENRRD